MTSETAVFRPRRLRVIAVVAVVGLPVLAVLGWFALPEAIRDQFTLSQIVTLAGVLVVLIAGIVAFGGSYVRVDQAGLKFRNGFRTHRIDWSQVHKLRLRPGDPWAYLLVRPGDGQPFEVEADAERFMLMGIQTHDGQYALDAVDELREWLAERA